MFDAQVYGTTDKSCRTSLIEKFREATGEIIVRANKYTFLLKEMKKIIEIG